MSTQIRRVWRSTSSVEEMLTQDRRSRGSMSSVKEVSTLLRRSRSSVAGDTIHSYIYILCHSGGAKLIYSKLYLPYLTLVISGYKHSNTVFHQVLSQLQLQGIVATSCVCVVSPLLDVVDTSIGTTVSQGPWRHIVQKVRDWWGYELSV